MIFVRTDVVCIVWRMCDKIIILVKQKVYCRPDWEARRAFFPHRIAWLLDYRHLHRIHFSIRQKNQRETIRNKIRFAVSRTRAQSFVSSKFRETYFTGSIRFYIVPYSFRNDRQNNLKRRILNGIVLIASHTRIQFRTSFSLFLWNDFDESRSFHQKWLSIIWRLRANGNCAIVHFLVVNRLVV